MALIIQLREDEQTALEAKARAKGLSPEDYARQVLAQDLVPEWLRQSWARAAQSGAANLSVDEICAEIAAARAARRNASI